MRRRTNPLVTLGAVIAVVVVAWWTGGFDSAETRSGPPAQTRSQVPPQTAPQTPSDTRSETTRRNVPAGEQAQLDVTLALIERGGPFPHRQDGATFSNREGRLPQQPQGYYREYTVPTPGAKNRGARRVVKGRGGETWYTRDHYRTFIRLH